MSFHKSTVDIVLVAAVAFRRLCRLRLVLFSILYAVVAAGTCSNGSRFIRIFVRRFVFFSCLFVCSTIMNLKCFFGAEIVRV